jgi:hypothetical protein
LVTLVVRQLVSINVVPNTLKNTEVSKNEENENQSDNSRVDIFPNPVTNNLLNIRLEGTIQEEFNLVIYDLSGRTLIQEHYKNESSLALNLSEFSKGMYILNIFSRNYNSTKKFIVN